MVETFRVNGKDPVIYLCLPSAIFEEKQPNSREEFAEQRKNLTDGILPIVREVAQEIGAQIIDFNLPLQNQPEKYMDALHPNDEGAAVLAQTACDIIKTAQAINPVITVSKGEVVDKTVALVEKGGTVTFSPEPATDGSWRWSGPKGFTSTERVITLENVQRGGTYTATRTDVSGSRSILNFVVSVKGLEGKPITANSTRIVAKSGTDVTFSPKVSNENGGSWVWRGPDNFFAGKREATLWQVKPSQAGEYTVVYTDDYGCPSSLVFTLVVN